MIEGIAFVLVIALVAGLAGLGLGILLSRPLSRLADRALADATDSEEVDPGDRRG